MNDVFSRLHIRNCELPRQRIREHVRGLITAGDLAPGAEMPSTRELAALWRVDMAIVHAALADLVKERLVMRRHGKGTFVAEKIAQLHCVGLYAKLASLSAPNKWFVRSVLVEVQKLLARRGISVRAWLDPRSPAEREGPWDELELSARNREMQALIMIDFNHHTLKWTKLLPVPLAAISSASQPYAVGTDSTQMFKLAMKSLADSGCRSMGLITCHPVDHVYEKYYGELVELAATFGLKIKNSWIRIPKVKPPVGDFAWTRFGYHQFNALWDLKDRPDGLIVEPDIVVEGVVTAILERGVRIPQELKVVLHKNENHEYLCPFPASYLVQSEKAYAEALISQIEKQVAGKICTRIFVSYQLLENQAKRV